MSDSDAVDPTPRRHRKKAKLGQKGRQHAIGGSPTKPHGTLAQSEGRGVPPEILDIIFSFCDRQDLPAICLTSRSFSYLARPILYRHFAPTQWTDIVELARSQKKRLRLDETDTSLSSMQHLDLAHIDEGFCKEKYQRDNIRGYLWCAEEALRGLLYILKKVKKLKSFTSHQHLYDVDSTELWDRLSRHPLKELALYKSHPTHCHSNSRIYSISTLTKLHITFNHQAYTDIDMKGLLKLLQSSSGLQDLKLHASSHWHWHGGGLHETIFPQDIKDLYRCKSLGRLRFLDLQGINCARQPQKVFEFLSTLQSLETFVFKLSSDMMYQEEPLAWTGEKDGFLPALQDVDVSEYVLLHGILHYSKPKVVRSLNCTHFCEGEDFFTDVLTLPLFPSGCDSVEEVHLSIPSDEFTNGAVSISFVEALRTIPSNVKRLNIYHDGTDKVVLSHDSIEQDVLKGLDHLTGLTRLILPWTCNLHESKALGEDKEVAVDKRAAKIAVSLNLPSLEYVFFQGSNVIDPVTDSPKWKASFNEKEDLHKRWIVKIEREPAVAGDGEQCDGDCRIGFCEWCKDLDWSTSLRVSAGVKIATVISSSCTYDECWMVEELDLEKRKCLEDQRGSSA